MRFALLSLGVGCGLIFTLSVAAQDSACPRLAVDAQIDFARLQQNAEAGDPCAQDYLGILYFRGQSVPQDFEEALRWLQQAADQGHARGQQHLGFMYLQGRGVPQDFEEALRWTRLAAEQGFADAQDNLAFMYRRGLGVRQDDTEAVRWWQLAAEQGHANAQEHLGYMYSAGRGVRRDDMEAVRWWQLAAEPAVVRDSGCPQFGTVAQINLARIRENAAAGDGCSQDYLGSANAQSNLGIMYEEGRGVPQSDSEAARWYRMAAEQGDATAQNNLGLMYEEGRGVSRDFMRAYVWYSAAAVTGRSQGNQTSVQNVNRVARELTRAQRREAQRLATVCLDSDFQNCGEAP